MGVSFLRPIPFPSFKVRWPSSRRIRSDFPHDQGFHWNLGMAVRVCTMISFRRFLVIGCGMMSLAELAHGATFTNRLAKEKSPYLLQHAHNPVDWYPWGEEAFAAAKKENKPIFLSVGYSTCHWCHVMERESFEDSTVAAFMNEHFINIKVDREERPDVDAVYMSFVQATTGGGGWPMSVWLTPDREPMVGGTYFPPKDAYGRPGFLTMLKKVSKIWQEDEAGLRTQAGEVTRQLQKFSQTAVAPGKALTTEVLERGLKEMTARFDAEKGGFGPAPKFPRPSELIFLFTEAERVGPDSESGRRAQEMALFTLEKMAAGGIHDHLGGGFHRYSVDAEWHVPHFEKMLYDQAQLADAYLIAYQVTGRELFAETARDIFDYVLRDMTSPDGGFYSAEDADSVVRAGFKEKKEGAFYVWTEKEIVAALGDSAPAVVWFFGVEPEGNTSGAGDPHGELTGKNVLIQRHTLAEAAEKFGRSEEAMAADLTAGREKLFRLREQRPRPHLDDKVITAWNGLMISAFAKGYRVLGEERYLTAANRAADFVKKNLFNSGGGTLLRSWRDGSSDIEGFAADYAYTVQGLLDLYESSFEIGRLQWALDLQKKQDALFWDDKAGGYFSSSGTDPTVLLRMKDDYDGAEPSPNTISALNLLRWAHLFGDPDWTAQAERTLTALAPQMWQSPLATPMGLVALDVSLSPGRQIVVVGDFKQPNTGRMLRTIGERFLPGSVWALVGSSEDRKFFSIRAEFYQDVQSIDGKPTAYVCRNFVCNLPMTSVEELEKELGSARGESANTP